MSTPSVSPKCESQGPLSSGRAETADSDFRDSLGIQALRTASSQVKRRLGPRATISLFLQTPTVYSYWLNLLRYEGLSAVTINVILGNVTSTFQEGMESHQGTEEADL